MRHSLTISLSLGCLVGCLSACASEYDDGRAQGGFPCNSRRSLLHQRYTCSQEQSQEPVKQRIRRLESSVIARRRLYRNPACEWPTRHASRFTPEHLHLQYPIPLSLHPHFICSLCLRPTFIWHVWTDTLHPASFSCSCSRFS